MDLGQAVTTSPAAPAGSAGRSCPRCGRACGPLPEVPVRALRGGVSRCLHCGTRRVAGSAGSRWVFACVSCGLPFADAELLARDAQRCPACAEGRPPEGLPERELIAATEAEVRAALRERWRFVGSAELCDYLDRRAGALARSTGVASGTVRVVLIDDASYRTLALPSGTLLVSLGALASLDNEAELAFLLGHELGHTASGDAATRLVRLGLDNLRREGAGNDSRAWADAAEDLIAAGYGRRREREADGRAIEAMISLRYDPAAACRLLARLEERMRGGEPELAELAISHPPPGDRIRRIERILHPRLRGDEPFRLNREVFRRAAGREVLARPLAQVPLDPPPSSVSRPFRDPGLPAWVATAAGVGLIAALILLLAYLLAR